MQRNQFLRRFGLVGLVLGLATFVIAPFVGELGGMLVGYGSLVVFSAGYLLVGLAIRDRLRHRTRTTRTVTAYARR